MQAPTLPSLAVLGSCVTRDPLNHILAKVKIASYFARTCVTSMMSPPVQLDFSVMDTQAPAFEKRCVVADLEKTWLTHLSTPADLVVLDFVDERFGLGIIEDKVFTFSTALRRALDESGAVLSNMRYVSPFSDEYRSRLLSNLPQFCEKISVFPNLLVNDCKWTSLKEDGSYFSDEKRVKVKKSNENIDIILSEIAKRTSAKFLGIKEEQLVAKLGHRWGDAPFHYSEKTENLIAEKLYRAAEEAKN